MNSSITPERVREYIDGNGEECLHCGNIFFLTAGEIDLEAYARPVTCSNCGAEWKEVFKMSHIIYEGTEIQPAVKDEVTAALKALMLVISEDEDDYPDGQLYKMVMERYDAAQAVLKKLEAQ